jgi:hypothetical protein
MGSAAAPASARYSERFERRRQALYCLPSRNIAYEADEDLLLQLRWLRVWLWRNSAMASEYGFEQLLQ